MPDAASETICVSAEEQPALPIWSEATFLPATVRPSLAPVPRDMPIHDTAARALSRVIL